jgi:hypothetical protein
MGSLFFDDRLNRDTARTVELTNHFGAVHGTPLAPFAAPSDRRTLR